VHGGMGYIEETGVAQYYRDARIAPIYEGTNGIQAMDLVGRKLPMRGGGAMYDFLAGIAGTADELAGSGDDLAAIGKRLADAHATLKQTTDWLMAGLADPNIALAGATPYVRMCGMVTGGWLLARSALAANRALANGNGDDDGFLRQKIVTARFYAEQLLPQAAGLAPAVQAGPADLLAAVF
jgi:3-(methylthio)propanoyl-CoA dehydrogenase